MAVSWVVHNAAAVAVMLCRQPAGSSGRVRSAGASRKKPGAAAGAATADEEKQRSVKDFYNVVKVGRAAPTQALGAGATSLLLHDAVSMRPEHTQDTHTQPQRRSATAQAMLMTQCPAACTLCVSLPLVSPHAGCACVCICPPLPPGLHCFRAAGREAASCSSSRQ